MIFNQDNSDLVSAITSNTTAITGIENAIAYVENNFNSASRTYKAGEFFYSTQYNRLYKTTSAVPQGTSFENHIVWITEGGLNNAITPTSETISTGITGVSAKKVNGWFVQIGFYITTAITVDAGAVYSLGTLPEALRPSVNQSYLLLFAKANNAPTVAGLRVAASGEVLVYNIGGSAITYQTIQGLAYYPTI